MITKRSNFAPLFLKETPLILSLLFCFIFVSCQKEKGFKGVNQGDQATSQSKLKGKRLKRSIDSRLGLGEFFVEKKIRKNSNFAETLEEMNFSYQDILQIIKAVKPFINFSKLQINTVLQKKERSYPLKEFLSLEVFLSWIERVVVEKGEKGEWKARKKNLPITTKVTKFNGVVEASLWNSAVKAGLDPAVIEKLSQIFAWEIDFNREVLPVDSWRIIVEEKWAGGKRVSWGHILAAEYKNGNTYHKAVRFPKGKGGEYYDLEGKSLKKKFLKSPLRFGRITSRFTRRRFHPILKIRRPHYGVDYAAPKGTPIFAVGDGRVTRKHYSKWGGKTIKIRHNSVYQTAYKHLSKFHPSVRRGRKVKQGQVIGYVGSTGLSTGPHLHFEFYQGGRYVDPLGKKFPQLKKIKKENLISYKSFAKEVWKFLPERQEAVLLAKKTNEKKKKEDL